MISEGSKDRIVRLPSPGVTVMDFEALYEQHAGWMYRLAFAILRQPQDAEDAVQEAFLTVARKTGFYGTLEAERLKAALTVITRSRALNILRKRREIADSELTELNLPGDRVSFTFGLSWEEAVASLPSAVREMVLLHFADGFTAEEIADMLDAKKETVRKTLYRARKQIRRHLEEGD